LNVNEAPHTASYAAEFTTAATLMASINAREREFYDFVGRWFNALEADAYLRRRSSTRILGLLRDPVPMLE
jgi:hypothetical protein